ncbi:MULTISPECIES: methyltransferase domain-containing protein [Halocynthiibacter]|uniref:Methyltransferase domain-containing protein n=1 Tax=Halocynthiibacter halioticoli TaxID=2986804 RepID=A0AAE3J2L1_9RHOB|nr:MULTISPECIES: methyltransferase domain-containing protein [Halocynthiibacter]MCV6825578.1 methyltransferase domain-containing protein [Halocynthiibacter halioticoli]MCW4058579.1 methyltransferase domain-containing protein [Halocynthiibacter sp. SDUM655004]
MNNQPPELTERKALELHRARAQHDALFLQLDTADEIQERLTEVNRRFTNPAIVTAFPEIWRECFPNAKIISDTDVLSLEQQAHDLVIHALCLHWANDPVGQLVQSRRALKPDGLFIGAMFGGQTLAELRSVLAEVESATTGGISPRVAPMAEIRDLGGLLQRAGFALPVADSAVKTVTYSDAVRLMHDLRHMGEGNALAQRHKKPLTRSQIEKIVETYATHFPSESGRIRATFEIVYLTGWAPDDSQQKPLRPGSATTRLADALGTSELTIPNSSAKTQP